MERQRFEALVIEHLDALFRLAMQLARHPDEASDLVQETCLKAFGAAGSFQELGGGIRPWLFKILHNIFYTRLERARRTPVLMENAGASTADDEPAPGDALPVWDLSGLDWEQVDGRLAAAIEQLRPEYRTVLLLWGVEGLKYREIALILNVPIGTVMSRIHRARSILGDQLADLAEETGRRRG